MLMSMHLVCLIHQLFFGRMCCILQGRSLLVAYIAFSITDFYIMFVGGFCLIYFSACIMNLCYSLMFNSGRGDATWFGS